MHNDFCFLALPYILQSKYHSLLADGGKRSVVHCSSGKNIISTEVLLILTSHKHATLIDSNLVQSFLRFRS